MREELQRLCEQIKPMKAFDDSSGPRNSLSANEIASLRRIKLEAKGIIDTELGLFNHFSTALPHVFVNRSSANQLEEVITGAMNHMERYIARGGTVARVPTPYVDPQRLMELRRLPRKALDLSRLIRICEELNTAYAAELAIAVAALTRALIDHVPPLFGMTKFAEIANNYQGARTFKESMKRLDESSRKISDAHLHTQIRASEVIPTLTQVDFRQDVDVLISEIVRISA